MGRSKQLSNEVRKSVIELERAGLSNKVIASQLRISESAVSRLLQRHRVSGTFSPRPRSGRPSKVTKRTKRRMSRTVMANPFITSVALRKSISELCNVSKPTICRILQKEMGYVACKPTKKPMMNKKHLQQRLEFCRRHEHWTADDWSKVMWSDESTFQVFTSSERFVRRSKHSNPCDPRFTRPSVKHPPSITGDA